MSAASAGTSIVLVGHVTKDGALVALDAKINVEANAMFRQPALAALRDPSQEDPMEREAAEHELNYVALDGNIACMVNGAGLAMATMDLIKLHGGEPANFLDVGGTATAERVTAAFQLILSNDRARAVLVDAEGVGEVWLPLRFVSLEDAGGGRRWRVRLYPAAHVGEQGAVAERHEHGIERSRPAEQLHGDGRGAFAGAGLQAVFHHPDA